MLASRYPGFAGLEPGFGAPTRHHYRRYETSYLHRPDVFKELHHVFRGQACALARAMGMFDPDAGTISRPDVKNLAVGDGTVVRPRFRARLGDQHLNTQTGELEQRRYDPDAADYATWDPDTSKSITVRGIKFGLVWSHLRDVSNQRVILDVFHVPTGDGGEAARAVDSITTIVGHAGAGAQGVCWDMALRDIHKDPIYALGLMPIVKTAKAPGGAPKTAQLGLHPFTLTDGQSELREVFSRAGAALIEVVVGRNRIPILLDRRRTRRVGQRARGYRWYNDYAVPATAPVPPHLRGATVSVRLNRSTAHARVHNRAEILSAISQDDPDWE